MQPIIRCVLTKRSYSGCGAAQGHAFVHVNAKHKRGMKRHMEDTHSFECPITLCRVRGEAGVTATGQAYDYAAIHEWMKTHDTDPATGVRLNTVGIIRITFKTEKELKTRAAEAAVRIKRNARFTSQDLPEVPPQRIGPFLTPDQAAKPAWEAYSRAVCAALGHSPLFPDSPLLGSMRVLRTLVLQQLGVTAAEAFNAPLFCDVAVTPDKLAGKEYKFADFSGARVSGSFRNVCFSRTQWTDAEFAPGTTFLTCNFSGEEVTFARSTGGPVTIRECTIEQGCTWRKLTTDKDAVDEFRLRGLNAVMHAAPGPR